MISKIIMSLFSVLISMMLILSACAATGKEEGFLIDDSINVQDRVVAEDENVEEIQEEKGTDTQESSEIKEKEILVGHADFPYYYSLNDLYRKSDYVVYGTVLSKSYEWRSLRVKVDSADPVLNPGGEAHDDLTLVTVFEISVIKDYSAKEIKSNVIKLLIVGGETETEIIMIEGTPDIEINEQYVFFLSKSANVENGAWLLNDTQALYVTDGITISRISEEGFELTFEQLDEMAQVLK